MNPNELMVSLERQLKPYRGEFPLVPVAAAGSPGPRWPGWSSVWAAAEESRWRDGFALQRVLSGALNAAFISSLVTSRGLSY